ncbi:MAG: hypothetical protein CL521_06010 [Actinobacteria bacterium]|nr:hypothetical protein [Actinomycetota bacterium]|tara:strand:- start:169 stop:594 length:426 start_codon:yes stop_codon:yes gene_type:complete
MSRPKRHRSNQNRPHLSHKASHWEIDTNNKIKQLIIQLIKCCTHQKEQDNRPQLFNKLFNENYIKKQKPLLSNFKDLSKHTHQNHLDDFLDEIEANLNNYLHCSLRPEQIKMTHEILACLPKCHQTHSLKPMLHKFEHYIH